MTDDPDSVFAASEAFIAASTGPCPFSAIRGSPPFFVEFLDSSVCKGKGLERLCGLMNVPFDQVVAFGDGDNDIEFLQVSGLGIAMCNAREVVKLASDQVSERPNTEDGVLYELEKLTAAGRLVPAPNTADLEALLE
jgi:hydroxymethylpyrimidine pyrophosphatase-like HAD family hydrolase